MVVGTEFHVGDVWE